MGHPHALAAVARDPPRPRLMPNLDITVIPLTDMPITDMDMVFPDVALLILEDAFWERGQLRLMPNLDFTDIVTDMVFTDLITDTVLTDLVSPVILLVPLTPTEASKDWASKSAISGVFSIVSQIILNYR